MLEALTCIWIVGLVTLWLNYDLPAFKLPAAWLVVDSAENRL